MFTDNAIQILKARYLLRNTDGDFLETPEQLFKRVANHMALQEASEKEKWSNCFYQMMSQFLFLPNSPTLMNAGLPHGQLSACFVLPVADSLTDIFETLKNAALIHQSGGGTGYNFSKLRPKGDPLTKSGGLAAGPIAFMKIFDGATEHVKQGGKRRGANMGILNVDHPDIEDFINAKMDGRSLSNFNLSVGIGKRFMHAVRKEASWHLINPRTKKVQKTLKALELWNTICTAAWSTGDPGLIFLDTINKSNPIPRQGWIMGTNPCGEVPLLEYESCNLGSINLAKMVKKGPDGTQIDWKKLGDTVSTAVRFLDNVISTNHYLLSQIKEKSTANRKIGLGVMGWAELLIMLGIPYASKKAVGLGERLMQFIKTGSYEASEALAQERGTFPSWKNSIHAPQRLLRNATLNSIAPTGTISVIANTSYSIEPLYALAYKRVGILENNTQNELNGVFVQKMEQLGFWNQKIRSEVIKTGSIQHIPSVPNDLRALFLTSLEIPWKYHLLHQRAFQRYTDNAVSKTINLAETTTAEEISYIYKKAWEYGLKGITVYRDGSKPKQVLQHCGPCTDKVS